MRIKLMPDIYLIKVPTRQKKVRIFLKGMFESASFMGLFTPLKALIFDRL